MTPHARLRGQGRFAAVFQQGKTISRNLMVVKALPNGLPEARFGYAVGKAIGPAVVRNRLRRRLRETVRQLPVRAGWDIILIPRSGAREADFQELRQAVMSLLGQAGLLNRE